MSGGAFRRVGLWTSLAGCFILAAFISLSPTAQGDKSRTANTAERDKDSFDAELYESISARLVADETDLIEAMFLDYLGVYPLIPPVADFSLTFDMGTIPFNAGTFPDSLSDVMQSSSNRNAQLRKTALDAFGRSNREQLYIDATKLWARHASLFEIDEDAWPASFHIFDPIRVWRDSHGVLFRCCGVLRGLQAVCHRTWFKTPGQGGKTVRKPVDSLDRRA